MSNTNWKVIGTNSGNMSRHRNVKAGKLNYEDGKWKSIYDASGNKKIVHDLSDNVNNQNAVVGIGTSNPFSRLSLGSNPGDGTIGNETTIGQIAAIALHEESNGTNFHGITYITDVSENQDVGGKVNALALHSNTSNENIDLSAAKVYVTDDGVLRIGGKPRTGPAVIDNEYTVYPQVTLDLSGSMQIDGFISFCNLNSAAGQPKDNVANASGTPDIAGTREIPLGAIWVGKKDTATTNVALYIQGAGRKRLELASTAAVAEAAKNGWDISSNPNKFMYNVIEDGGGYVSSNITINSADFSTWTPVHVAAAGADFGKNFLNALSIRGGSLAVSSSDTLGIMHGGIGLGVDTKPIQAGFTASQLGLSGEITDVSSGVIFAEKQILIGTGGNIMDDFVQNLRPRALLDISGGTPYPIAGIMIGHGIPQGKATSYNIPRATNSIIIGTIGVSKRIGAVDKDVSNSVVMGELNTIDRASTTIVAGNTNKIADSSGSLLLLGFENGNILSTKATNSLIVGWKNNVVDSGQGRSSGGNVIFGKENYYTADVWTDGYNVGINENNAIFGKSNTIKGTEFSFIQGKDNKTYGKELVVFGDSNTVGATTASPAAPQSDHYVQKCLVHGNTNTILGPSGETPIGTASNRLSNVYMMGHENTINIGQENTNAYNIANWGNLTTEETFVLLGSRTEIRDKVGRDNSGVRFAFGTNAMYEDRILSNADACGNVFTIDNMGSVWIAGNLIVDGSQVILRTEYFDVSDAALTLNSADHDPNGGGFHILDTNMAASRGHPPGYHSFTWTGTDATDGEFNTGSADLSTNDLLVLGKLTVNGLIDPTGLVLDKQASVPHEEADKATIWYDQTTALIMFSMNNPGGSGGTTGNLASKAYVDAQVSGGGGTSANSDKVKVANESTANDDREVLFCDGAAGDYEDIFGDNGVFTYNPSTSTLTTTTFSGALTGNADTATKSTNIVGGLVGQLPYQSAADTTVLLAANLTATKKFLTGTGTGSAGQAPAWGVLASGDIPNNAADTTGNAGTATALETARNIGGVSFNGTAAIVPNTIAVNDTANSGCSVALFESATGSLAPKTDAGLTYAADTGILSATGFSGPLTGNATTATNLAGSSHTQNTVYAAPDGSAGAASFRALVSDDIPDEAVTYAKMQHAAANTILVRDANSIGDISAKAVADKEILIGDGTGFTAAALSGAVTMTNAGVCTIPQGTVGVHDLAHVNGNTVIVRNDGTAGALSAMAVADSEFIIGNGGDGFVVKPLSGDVTMTLDGSHDAVVTIADEAVTFAKMQHAAASTILVRDAAIVGDISAKAVADTQILIGNGAGFTAAALSQNITMTNTGAVTIADEAVTFAKMQHAAGNTILVRDTNSSGDIQTKEVADTQILIGDGDGFTAAALSNDVTMTNAGAVTIANDAVTYAKMQDTTTNNRVLGAATAGTIGEVQVSNDMLVNKKVTIGSTDVDLGATVTTFAGLTLTTPIISSISNTGTITLPTTTGTLGLLGQVATGVDVANIDLDSTGDDIDRSFTTANIFTNVLGDTLGQYALNITNPIVGGLIIVTEVGDNDALVKIGGGATIDVVASASSVIIITGATAGVKIFEAF